MAGQTVYFLSGELLRQSTSLANSVEREHNERPKGSLLEWMNCLGNQETWTAMKDKMSGWRKGISGAFLGSVLLLTIFLIYINDMLNGNSSYESLFADDAEIMKTMGTERSAKT